MKKGVQEADLEREIDIWELVEDIKEAIYKTAERDPAGIPFVKHYHIEERVKKEFPEYIAKGVEEELSDFF